MESMSIDNNVNSKFGLDHLVIRASFTKDERELKVKSEDMSFDALFAILYELYPDLPNDFLIKYRDDEGDLVTVGCDRDISEAFKWISKKKEESTRTLHLFLISQDEEHKNISHGITNLFLKLSLEEKDNRISLLIKGSQWDGECKYPDGSIFPFAIRIDNCNDNTLEGIISWKSLNAVTKFLEKIVGVENNGIKLREYEALRGEDEVELPTNYQGQIEGNKIWGSIIPKRKKDESATFTLEFSGINSKKEGLFALLSSSKHKRKFNLVTNNSAEGPTADDQRSAFKKLVGSSEYWYDRTKRGELQPRSKEEIKKEGYRKSCPHCAAPMFDQPKRGDPTKTVLGCPSYPYCKENVRSYYSDSDYDSC